MLIERTTFTVAPGRLREVKEIFVTHVRETATKNKWRVYVHTSGRIHRFSIEVEFKDYTDRDEFWTARRDNPQIVEWLQNYQPHLLQEEFETYRLTDVSE